MRASVLLLLAIVAVGAEPNYHEMFEKFKVDFKRAYATKKEEAKRFRAFVQNMETAAKLQIANPLATFGANDYADLTAAEFKTFHSGEKYFAAQKTAATKATMEAAFSADEAAAVTKIDWRAKGAVTSVKNQGFHCGSCWSFSTTGNIEGQWFLAGNKLTSASEQELVSCDTTDGGCHGGLPVNAFEWLISTRGGQIVTEASYPYVSGNGYVPPCSVNRKMPVAATITGYVTIPPHEEQMAAWCNANGPISIGVDGTSWQSYTGGILTNCISQKLDHAVLIVGFDLTASTPYWIIKNSWGVSWGENGYIRVAYGSDQCLLSSAPTSSKVGNGTTGPLPPPPPPGPTAPTTTPPPVSPTTPPPIPPPPPPTSSVAVPTATQPAGTFEQVVCVDRNCAAGCKKYVLPQDECLQTGDGNSAVAQCGSAGLVIAKYSTGNCTGTPSRFTEPVDKCLPVRRGTYIENICSAASSSSSGTQAAAPGSVLPRNFLELPL